MVYTNIFLRCKVKKYVIDCIWLPELSIRHRSDFVPFKLLQKVVIWSNSPVFYLG